MSYAGRIRVWTLVLTLGGCITQSGGSGPDTGWGSGFGGGGGPGGFGCHMDADCGGTGNVCARNGQCVAPSDVKTVHVVWTVLGTAASATSCTSSPDLELTFFGNADQFGFAPVPCAEGKFTVDKLPTWYNGVELSRSGDARGAMGAFDATGTATLDLPF